jgi:hypothetical protein
MCNLNFCSDFDFIFQKTELKKKSYKKSDFLRIFHKNQTRQVFNFFDFGGFSEISSKKSKNRTKKHFGVQISK